MRVKSILSTIERGLGRDFVQIILLVSVAVICVYILLDRFSASDRSDWIESERPMSNVASQRLDAMTQRITGLRLNTESFSQIENSATNGQVMFVYSDSDCGKCLLKGQKLLEQIAAVTDWPILAVNRSGQKDIPVPIKVPRISNATASFENLAEQLNYVPTPLTILLGNDSRILAVHFTTLFDDSERASEFLSEAMAIDAGQR